MNQVHSQPIEIQLFSLADTRRNHVEILVRLTGDLHEFIVYFFNNLKLYSMELIKWIQVLKHELIPE